MAPKIKVFIITNVVMASLLGTALPVHDVVRAQTKDARSATKRPFTVADDIQTTYFGDPQNPNEKAIQFSPDGEFFAIRTQRGQLDLNRPADNIRIYSSHQIQDFVRETQASLPSPVWDFTQATGRNEPVIKNWRWLADSSGIAFLVAEGGVDRLVLADLNTKTLERLTPDGQSVMAFDIRDRAHFVYVVNSGSLELRNRLRSQQDSPMVIGTGRDLNELLFPDETVPRSDRGDLWAMLGGNRFQVKSRSGRPIVLFSTGQAYWALAPDGAALITTQPVDEIPESWESLYPPPYAGAYTPLGLRARRQDTDTLKGYGLVEQYVRIDLKIGTIHPLMNAPTGFATGWYSAAFPRPAWSTDSQLVLVPDTFLASQPHSAPCVAVVDFRRGEPACVAHLTPETRIGQQEPGYRQINNAYFATNDKNTVIMDAYDVGKQHGLYHKTVEYHRKRDDTWEFTREMQSDTEPYAAAETNDFLEVSVKEGPNDPPMLVAKERHGSTSRTIWDANPQLKSVDLGTVETYEWRDKNGRDRWGLLYKPGNYVATHRYPLVIQTHGAYKNKFNSSGMFPSGMAARALAVSGILVLQVPDAPCKAVVLDEAHCHVEGYEAAIEKLVSEQIVDSNRIGIVGFSRTCAYVMEAVTNSALKIKAATLTDGTMFDYFQYLLWAGKSAEENIIMGGAPFGSGLQLWLKRSPSFRMDKVTAALQVVGLHRWSLLTMWPAYAAMTAQHKPAELILINSDHQHILTNPGDRIASQGGTVDWFRFWLKGEEDPDPLKAEQYARWRKLRKLQLADSQKVDHSSN